MEWLVVGDTHSDGMPSDIPKNIAHKAVKNILKQAIEYTQQANVKNICLLGDLFDGYPGSYPAHIDYLEFFDECEKEDILVRVIDGNHGFIDVNSTSLDLLKRIVELKFSNVKIITHKPCIEKIDDEQCIFLPWPLNNAAELSRKPSLVFAHVARPGVKMPSGYQLKVDDFELGKHFWVIGDIHEPQQGKRFIYPGAPLQLKYGDSKHRSFVHIDWNTGEEHTIKRIPIVPPYTLGVLVADTFDDLKVLAKRPSNEWTKVKVSRELLANKGDITRKYQRLNIEPQVKTATKRSEVVEKSKLIFANTFEFRSTLLEKHLKMDGINKIDRKRAIAIAKKLEEKIIGK